MAINWTHIYKKYKGFWVALKKDQVTVISSAKTFKEAIEKAKKEGYSNPIMHRVPIKVMPYVGGLTHEI